MTSWRERFPYEWCVAVSAAIALAISPWVPSMPFSELLAVWSHWIGESLLGWNLAAPTNGFLALFLPIYAAVLGLPLLVFCSRVLEAPKSILWIAGTAVALMFVLAGMGALTALIELGAWLACAQIAVGCAIGVLFLALGVQLHIRHPLSLRIRALAVLLVAAGACMATFVLLPAGLFLLGVGYIALVPVLASRQSERFERAR